MSRLRHEHVEVDIVIANHNNGDFLVDAIESARRQDHPNVNIVVVDDGSTDDSRERLRTYAGAIEVVLKANGGQASAINAGVARCRGDVVILLDADDVLKPQAADWAAAVFAADPAVAKVQFRMDVIDAAGRPTGATKPQPYIPMPDGDVRAAELMFPFDLSWVATSGNAFRADTLRKILPIPEGDYPRCGADWYLVHLTALLGPVVSLENVGASYRVHGRNSYEPQAPRLELEHVRQTIDFSRSTARALERLADELSLERPDPIISMSDVGNRLISHKLEPELHPVPTDSAKRLVTDAIRAAHRRFDIYWPMKLMFAAWCIAVTVAPRRVARFLAELLMFPERRPLLNRLLGRLHRDPARSQSHGSRGLMSLSLRAHVRDPLYRTGYLLIVGTGITTLVGFLFWGLAAHTYSARAVGINSAAISAMLLVSGASSLGLDAVLVRYLPTAGLSARALILRSYAATTIVSLVLGAGAALTSPIWSPSLRFLGDRPGWFIGFTLATAAWSLFFLQDSVLIGLRSAQWVPLENSLYAVVKLGLLTVAGALPGAGLFFAWNAPVGVGVALVSALIFGRLIPGQRQQTSGPLPDRRRILSMAGGNYGGTLFAIAGVTLLPILVTDRTNATQTAYFYVPWAIAAGLELIALNMMNALTVQGALDESRLRGLLRKAFLHTSRLVLPVAITCGVAAPWVLRAFGSHYAHAGAPLLRLLAAGMLPNVLVALAIGVARVQHKGMTVLAIQAARAGLVIGLSIVLLPSTGIEGVGIAWLVAQLAVAVALAAGTLRPLLAPARKPSRWLANWNN